MITQAWVGDGKLMLASDAGRGIAWPSEFAARYERTHDAIQRRKAWKHSEREQLTTPWGTTPADLESQRPPPRIVHATAGWEPGEIVYVLQVDDVCAVLKRDPAEPPAELRLHHGHDLRIESIDVDPTRDDAVLTVLSGASSGLALMGRGGGRVREITEGDSRDGGATWVPGEQAVVFHTSGVARNAQGWAVGREPFSIARLDLATGEIAPMQAKPDHDLVLPRIDDDGALWYIERPWEDPGQPPALTDWVSNLLLFPWRLLKAMFGWLDLFSRQYGGEELMPGGGAARKSQDEEKAFILGNVVDVARAQREAEQAGDELPGRVPQDWVLCRRPADGGEPEVIAKGVLAYALAPDGVVLYSNGRGIWRRDAGGQVLRVAKDEAITTVVALRGVE